MASTYDAIRELLLVDLPASPLWGKAGVSLVVVTLSILFLLTLWRTPSSLPSLDPVTATRIQQGLTAFFDNEGEFAPARAIVFGEAKGIVRRMKNEPDIFAKVQMEIEARKRNDNNWTFANQLNEALALVNALGLTPETPRENAIFLQMPLPFPAQSPNQPGSKPQL